jgi:hypothetical protein
VVLNRPFSSSTACFFAALSTASSLRLAAFAQRQDRRVTPVALPEPGLETFQISGHAGQNDI